MFKTEVSSAIWDPVKSKYIVKTRAVKDPGYLNQSPGAQPTEIESTEEQTDEADILISALGILEVINYPNIPGLETFKGSLFHSGAWDHGVDLKGKRVAVIGNGASA